jgi:hypothetical protein
LAADDNAAALELAAETHLDAVLLNCHRDASNSGLVTALRILQSRAAVLTIGVLSHPHNGAAFLEGDFVH